MPKIVDIPDPIRVLIYLGFSTDDPTNAITLSAENFPDSTTDPIRIRSCKEIVQTTSPLLTGETLLINVPTFPEG